MAQTQAMVPIQAQAMVPILTQATVPIQAQATVPILTQATVPTLEVVIMEVGIMAIVADLIVALAVAIVGGNTCFL